MKTFVAAVVGFAIGILVLNTHVRFVEDEVRAPETVGCTKQQAENVVNGVFSAEQVACMVLNLGVLGQSNAAAVLEQLCAISPALDQDVMNFINNMQAHPAELARLKAALAKPDGG
jgi:hypothetical protein